MRARVAAATLATAASLLLVGCQSTVDGAAMPPTTVADKDLFDPCRDLPDDAVRAVGADPTTKESDIGGAAQPGWKICTWDTSAKWYFLKIYSTSHTLGELRRNDNAVDFRDVVVGGRKAVQHRQRGEDPEETCFIGFPIAQGLVEITIEQKVGDERREETCVVATRTATQLLNKLPQ